MRLVAAFLRLIRWPNLLFIALTQVLFYVSVYMPLFGVADWVQLAWLVSASVFIAAAGYIINDYFDLNIDRINKPEKNMISTTIKRRWAIFWHLFLSMAGILCTMLATRFGKWYLVLANIACVILLWFYSTTFKKKLLVGNVLISVLTAWTVLILYFLKVPFFATFSSDEATTKLFRVAFLYGGFAFIISLVREAVKDMEDMIGDERYGCRTLPIVAGVRAAKVYVAVWTVVLIAALLILQLYIIQFGWYVAVAYCVLLVIFPLVKLLRQLFAAHSAEEFHRLSTLTKWVMFTGILSMVFFRIYS